MSRLLATALVIASFAHGQDTTYARTVIKQLTSRYCFGRGYVRHGLRHAAGIIEKEIRKTTAQPLFEHNYTQPFVHPVNTLPGKCRLSVNGVNLVTGIDYVPDASSPRIKGNFHLAKKDSAHYTATDGPLKVHIVKKLTFDASVSQDDTCSIQLLQRSATLSPAEAGVDIRPRLISRFESRNIGCVIPGKRTDSLIVFTAHYDHLGGIGKKTWFPGANDNACGVAMVLNLLRYYEKNPPAFTTAFVFFAGEETGLLGSRYFVSHSPFPLGKIRFLVNLDLVGTGDDGIMVVNGAVFDAEFERLRALNEKNALLKQVRKRGKAANSDHYWFTEAGVRCFFIYTMGGIAAYHDVYDIERTLPLTEYDDLFRLLVRFTNGL